MLIKEIMTKEPTYIDPSMPIHEAAGKMRDMDVGFLPVGENDRLVGMLTDRDIATRAVADGKDPKKTKVGDIMTREVEYCFDDQEIDEAGKRMMHNKIRRLVVLNHDKRLVGVCSIGDIAINSEGHKLTGEVLTEVSTSK